MADKKTPLPTRQPKGLVDMVYDDAIIFSRSVDAILQAALTHHFLFKKEERRRIYSSVPEKIFGRPIRTSKERKKC